MKVCDICLLKISPLSKEDCNCNCELKECRKSLNIKIYTEDRLTVVTGRSVEEILKKWKKRALKELKKKLHTHAWTRDDEKTICIKGVHENAAILKIIHSFFLFL